MSNKVYWACRRGMLELDSMLLPFFQDCFDSLTALEQQTFIQILQEPDPILFAWLMNKSEPDNDEFKAIIKKIRNFSQSTDCA